MDILDTDRDQYLKTVVGGESVFLCAQRGLFWPRTRTLIITDPHFGKADSFRSSGIPVPFGSTESDLDRLSQLLHITVARRLVILGDFFHTHASKSEVVLASLARWRNSHTSLEIVLVCGNHDLHAGQPPPDLQIVAVNEPWSLTPFVCRHHPVISDPLPGYSLAGHLHPYARLVGKGATHLRLPCFHMSDCQAVLPAFGSFTGGQTVRPALGERIFVTTGDLVMEARIGSSVGT